MQVDVLDRGPDNGEATHLRREHVDLVSSLPHIAEQTLNSIGRLVRSVSPKRAKSSGMASKEVKSSLTTDRVTWGAIPHPLGERGNAAPSR